jgi:acyl-CoA thioesterase-1
MPMRKLLSIVAILIVLIACTKKNPQKIACIGDSITEGSGILWPSKNSYPVVLDSILRKNYSVLNGKSGTCMLKNGDRPYWKIKEFSNVFVFQPNIIIIKLGTNDSKPQNWNENNYYADFQSMIDTLKTIQSQPKIYLCLPIPAYKYKWGINDSVIRAGVIPTVKRLAKENNLTVIDLYQPFTNHIEYYSDSIHPNEQGAKVIAETIAKAINL